MKTRAITESGRARFGILACFAALLLTSAVTAHAQVLVANSVNGITVSDTSSDGSGVLLTTGSFDMSGGNAVALFVTTEGAGTSTTLSATFAGQPMDAVTAREGAQSATVFYLLNPLTTSGAFQVTIDPNLSSIQLAYSQISLANVGGVAGTSTTNSTSNANTTPLDVSYTTATNGGFVLGAAANNDYNGARPISIAYGNPDTELLSFVDVGSSGHFHVYGDVPTAGSYTDGYLGQYQRTAIATVAFETANDSLLAPLSWAVANGNWDINATANWSNDVALVTYQEFFGTGPSVRFDDMASGTSPIAITLDTTVMPLSITHNATKDYTITGTGIISGGAGITKEGSGTFSLDTYNSFTGPVNLNAGTLALGVNANSVALGGAASLELNGGTLAWQEGSTEDISYNVFAGDTRPVNFNTNATLEVQDTTSSYIVYLGYSIGNGGPGGLIKTGPGTLVLQAGADYLGNTLVSEGTLGTYGDSALSNSAAIMVTSGATLDCTGYPWTLNSENGQILAGDGKVAQVSLTVAANTVVSPGTNGVVGTLTLGTAGNYDGNLTMEGGQLAFDISSTGPNDLLVVNGSLTCNGGSVALNVTDTLPNGTYKLMQFPAGYLSGLGTLAVTGFSQAGQVAFLSDANAGEVDLVVAPLSTKSLVWAGQNSMWDVGTSMSWLDGGALSVFNHGDAVNFNDSGAALPNVSLQTLLFPASITVNSSSDYSFDDGTGTGGGRISGTNTLTKSGSGTLTVNTVNNNSGGTIVNGGTLVVNGHIGSGPILNNATLIFGQNEDRAVGEITGSGSLTQQGTATLTVSGLGYSGPTTISSGTLQVGTGGAIGAIATSGITDDGTLALNSSSDLALPAGITGTGGVTKRGSGTLTINSASYTGPTTIDNDGGTIVAGAANAVNGALRVQANGTFDMNGFDQTIMGLTSTTFGGGVITNSGTSTNVLTVTVNDANDASISIDGPIQFVKLGTNELTMRADAATYTGGTIVGEGTLQARGGSGSGFFGTGSVTLSNNVALQFDNYPENDLVIADGASATLRARALGDGWGGLIFGNSDSTLIIGNEVSISRSQIIQFENFDGTVQVETNGTLRFSSSHLGSNGGNSTTFDVFGILNTRNGTPEGPGVLLGAFSGSGRLGGPQAGSGDSTYIIGAKGLDTTFSGSLEGSTPGSANSIVKVGTGTQTFTGTNTAAGSLTVSNGTLVLALDAAPTNMSPITVASGAMLDVTGLAGSTLSLGTEARAQTLEGDGTVVGSVVIGTNATVSPGASVGTLTIDNALTLDGTATMELDRTNSQTADLINAGSFTGSGTVDVVNIGPDLATGDTFQLFSSAFPGVVVNLPGSNALNTVEYVWNNKVAIDGSIELLSGASPVNPNPGPILSSYSGGVLSLSWPTNGGWTLQMQTNSLSSGLSTNWVDIPGSESITETNITVDPTEPTVFYRLKL